MKIGIVFEEAFNEALRRAGCMAVTCETWDRDQKTDSLVMRMDGRRLKHPVEVQVTLQCDNLLKISAYLAYIDGRARGSRRESRSLYVEVEPHIDPSVAAAAVKRYLTELATDNRATGPFGLRIRRDGEERFDPRKKCAQLADMASPTRTGHLRIGGAIIEVQPHGMLIATAERGLFWAFDGDIADRRLRKIVRAHRAGRRSAFGVGISLIADGVSNPHGRAKSVICAPASPTASPAAA